MFFKLCFHFNQKAVHHIEYSTRRNNQTTLYRQNKQDDREHEVQKVTMPYSHKISKQLQNSFAAHKTPLASKMKVN